jgi:hypothetical protein
VHSATFENSAVALSALLSAQITFPQNNQASTAKENGNELAQLSDLSPAQFNRAKVMLNRALTPSDMRHKGYC